MFLIGNLELLIKNIEVSQLDSFTIENRKVLSGCKCWYYYVTKDGLCEMFSIAFYVGVVIVRLLMWISLGSVKELGLFGSLVFGVVLWVLY